ncbi:DUF6942 family protein [Shewanella atlantica]|uniref:Uncharacterized protein n=1 Tax=Shewanella atlantica TaxID=271099 RepID=A0A431VT83_9GAMM|nr:hypothetical protein [Shewanella atlantica]RTR26313.1 hypothetical protein EKG39_22065 [Shewanella atlantica]
MCVSSTIKSLGSPGAKFCFYLPSAPIIPENWHHGAPDAVSQIIETNGNHWRKILTIMAKITAPDDNWKIYRDTQLLKRDEQILIDNLKLSSHAEWHFIVGGVSQKQLESETNEQAFSTLDNAGKLLSDGSQIFKVPYLDYRQYPNKLIKLTREQLSQSL